MTIDAAFVHFPSLWTHRLLLRPVQETDAEALFAIKSDPEVTRLYGQEPHRAIEDTLAWIRRLHADYRRREVLFWCLTRKGEHGAIGGCTFWNFSPDFRCVEIGYELHPAYWQQGLMTEAVSAVMTYGFEQLGLHRIEACPLAGNAASRALLQKLSFKYEGDLRQRHFFRGDFLDQLYYGLLRTEWTMSA